MRALHNSRSQRRPTALPATLQFTAVISLLLCGFAPVARTQLPSRASLDSAQRADSSRRRTARLAPVTIVATPARRDEPVSSVTVSPQMIRDIPSVSTWDLLRQAAGLEVHDQGQGPGFASNASMRGFSSDHSTDLALWIDGVPINEPVNGHAEGYNDLSVLFPQVVREIDVLKGPTSALFGNFALAGVVNVRTLERTRGTQANVSGGANGRAEATVLSGYDAGPNGGIFGVRLLRDDGWRPNSRTDLVQGHGRVVHDLSPRATVDAGVELYGARWHSPGYLSEDEFDQRAYGIVSNESDGGYKRRAQERISLRVMSSSGALFWRTTAYATQGRWQLFLTIPPAGGKFEGSGSQTEEEDTRYGLGLTSALTRTTSRGELTVGTEARLDHADYENWFTTARTRDSASALVAGRQAGGALFAQSALDLTSRLRITVGARLERLQTHSAPTGNADAGDELVPGTAGHAIVSPKLGVRWQAAPGLALYANMSRGFRQSDGVLFDPHSGFITAMAYEGGLKVDRGETSAALSFFRMVLSNEQTFDPFTGDASDGGASKRQGVEADLRVPLGADVTLRSTWTFNDAKYTSLVSQSEDDPSQVDDLRGLRVYNTARFVGVTALEWRSPASRDARWHWRARLASNVVGPYSPFDEPGVVLPSYGLVHAGVGVGIGRADLSLTVRNVLDRAYPELVAGGKVSPGQPRAVYAGVRWEF
jgi:outer membrane receptor protein involved in Fe transport